MRREKRISTANNGSAPSRTPSQRLGTQAHNIISFEHIDVNGIHPHDGFVELQNTMGILGNM